MRPGRIDRIIDIPLPDTAGRRKIFRVHSRRMNLSKNISLDDIASVTDGLNGAQIKSICTEAGMFAIRAERKTVTYKDMMKAIKKVKEGKEEGGLLRIHGQIRRDGHPMFA